MKKMMEEEAELSAAAAHAIAAGMRAVAAVDGMKPQEADLIADFEAGLPGVGTSVVDFAALDTPQARTIFMRSLVLVAFADGALTDAERDLIVGYTQSLAMPQDALVDAVTHVASVLLSRFAGVKIYRDQVVEIGRGLGLDEPTLQDLIG